MIALCLLYRYQFIVVKLLGFENSSIYFRNVAVGFNIEGVDNLNLTVDMLTGIYNGTIQKWNHSMIRNLNPTAELPDEDVVVIARSDNSGTTYAFSSALARGSIAWRNEFGTFSAGLDTDRLPINWKKSAVDYYGYTNQGVAGLIISVPNSLGYITVANNFNSKLKYAHIQNSAGNFIHPALPVLEYEMGNISEINYSENFSYPISAYTFFIVKLTQTQDCSSATEFVRYVDWFYNSDSAKSLCIKLNMLPLDTKMAAKFTTDILKRLTCHKQNVWMLVERQKMMELPEENDLTILYVIYSSLSILVIFLAAFIGHRWWLAYTTVVNDTWFMKYSLIIFDKDTRNKPQPHINTSNSLSTVNISTIDITLPVKQSSIDSEGSIWPRQQGYIIASDSIKSGVYGADRVYLTQSGAEYKVNTFRKKKLLIWFRDSIDHTNVAKYMGLTKSSIRWFSVYKGQTRGPVLDIIRDPKMNLCSAGLIVICKEIILGMEYLHEKGIIHGNLRGSTCLLDETWKVKISDWQHTKFASCDGKHNRAYEFDNKTDEVITTLYWVAPELIKSRRKASFETDVYAFGIVMQEIFSKNSPYNEVQLPPRKIISAVIASSLRPKITSNTPPVIRDLMKRTWDTDPEGRPHFHVLRHEMATGYPNEYSMADCIMRSIEGYALYLEHEVSQFIV